jgi:hypothetical protein
MARSAAETAAKVASSFDVSDNTKTVQVKDTVPSIATASAFVETDTVIDPPAPTLAKPAPTYTNATLAKTTPYVKVDEPIAKIAEPIGKPVRVPPPLQKVTPAQPLPVVAPHAFVRAKSPVTIIPIPKMPRVEPSRIAPVVARKPTGQVPVVPLRLAKGTGPVTPPTANSNEVGEQTKPNLAVGDKTLPSLLLPQVSRSR